MLLLSDDLFEKRHGLVLALEVLQFEDDLVIFSLGLLARNLAFRNDRLCPGPELLSHLLLHLRRINFTLVHVDVVNLTITHGHVLSLNVLSEVSEFVFEMQDFVVLEVHFFAELLFDLFPHKPLHQVIVIFQRSELAIGHIELVDNLIALCAHFSIHNYIDVAKELLTLLPVVNYLHVLQVDNVSVLVSHYLTRLHALPQVLFGVFQGLLAED